MTDNHPSENPTPQGRSPWFLIGGLVLLSAAVTLLMFGNDLFGGDTTTADQPPQVPDFATPISGVAALPSGNGQLEVGDSAVDFTLADLDGESVTLSQFAGKPVIINFWATWCAPCRIEMPELQQTYTAYADDGLEILALNQGEDAPAVNDFFREEMGLTFTPLLDREQVVADAYGAFNLPSTYFVAADGTISAVHRGPLTRDQLDGYLADILPQ